MLGSPGLLAEGEQQQKAGHQFSQTSMLLSQLVVKLAQRGRGNCLGSHHLTV